MAYCTLQDLIDRFGSDELVMLTDRASPPAGTIDLTVAGRAIADACDTIDAAIGAVYALPLSSVPARLTAIACDIARYMLYTQAPTDAVQARHAEALASLRNIVAGREILAVDGAPAATSGRDTAAVVGTGRRVFTPDSLADY